MKFIDKLKHKIAFHLFSIFGWIILFELFQISKVDGGGIFVAFLIPIWGMLLFVLLTILIIEHIVTHTIKNSFMITNRFYNIIWIIGFIISVFFTIFSIYAITLAIL